MPVYPEPKFAFEYDPKDEARLRKCLQQCNPSTFAKPPLALNPGAPHYRVRS